MEKSLSQDLRLRVIGAVQSCLSQHAAAARFEVVVGSAVRWLRAWHDESVTAPKPCGGDRHAHGIEALGVVIVAAIDAEPDITLTKYFERLKNLHGTRFARSTIWRFLGRQGVS